MASVLIMVPVNIALTLPTDKLPHNFAADQQTGRGRDPTDCWREHCGVPAAGPPVGQWGPFLRGKDNGLVLNPRLRSSLRMTRASGQP